LDAEAVIQIDHGAVAGRWLSIAAIVRPRHARTGLMQRVQRRSAGPLLPKSIAPADAFRDHAANAGKIEAAPAIGDRKAKPAARRIGSAKLDRRGVLFLHDEMMQDDPSAFGIVVFFNALDGEVYDALPASDLERRAGEIRTTQDAAIGGGQHEFGSLDRQAGLSSGRAGLCGGHDRHRGTKKKHAEKADCHARHR
jgi:hypothetical protein